MSTDTDNKVLSILENIKKGQDNNVEVTTDKKKQGVTSASKPKVKKNEEGIRGKPKSGRFWKSEKERFSSINKTKGLRQDFQRKTSLRIELQRVKELARQKQEELKQREQEKKERRRQNIKKTEENKKKSEIVQVITNTTKIKRMGKKQLRFIQKRDTNKEVAASK